MRKVFNNVIKKGLAVVLSVAVILPCAGMTVRTYAEETSLIKKYDFEKGFREFYDNDSAYKILSAGGQIVKKTAEQREESDRVDANGFVIQGEGANAKYATQTPGNQPSTKYDSDKGTVLFIAGTFDVPELVKEVSGVVENDDAAASYLDAILPVGSVAREAATFKSAMTFTNPFKLAEADSVSLAFWGKVPADSNEEKIAFVEFNNGNTAVSFCYDAAISRGDWHYYEYVIESSSIKAYVDGVASEITPVIDGSMPDSLVAFVKSANIYFGATNTSSVRTVEETVLDDVAFYNGSMTADEAKSLYDSALTEYNATVTVGEPVSFNALDSEECFENLNPENPSVIETFNINGHEVKGVAVVETEKGAEKNGIKVENPLAGMTIEGATVGYWVQIEPKAKILEKETVNNPEKGYTGNYPGAPVINETVTLAFMDTTKTIFNPKHGESAEGYSYLYTRNRMQAFFEEGGFYAMNTGNQFEIESSDEAAAIYADESRNWHYMTLVINNDGVTIYCDGKKIEGLYENRAPRFMDGYYRRVTEREKISTLYGTFGGSGNQLTSMITTFLTYEDTDMYFGWLPVSDFRNETTSPMNVARLSVYDDEMSSTQVAELYENELSSVLALPEYKEPVEYTLGDLNKDDSVNAADALIVLKIAAKIEESNEELNLIGDMDSNGQLNAADALIILKIAAKIEI